MLEDKNKANKEFSSTNLLLIKGSILVRKQVGTKSSKGLFVKTIMGL